MKKTLIALALAAVSVPALASEGNSVVLYGSVNVGVIFDDHLGGFFGGNDVRQTRVDNLSNNSRIGFKGVEVLGGGLKSFFRIETGLQPDNSTQSGQFGSREAWVGIVGSFGSISLGRGKHPFQQATEDFDPFDGFDGATLDLTTVDGGVGGTRASNTLRFDSHAIGGLSLTASYSTAENKSARRSATDLISLWAKYEGEGYFINTAYANNKNIPTGTSSAPTAERKTGYLLGGGLTAGDFTFAGAFEHTKDSGEKRNRYLVNGTYAMGETTFKAGYIYGDELKVGGNKVRDTDYGHVVVGVRQDLSKRTGMIVEYVQVAFQNKAQSGVAVKDPSAFIVGLTHSF